MRRATLWPAAAAAGSVLLIGCTPTPAPFKAPATFAPAVGVSHLPAGYPISTGIADVTGDGRPDLVVTVTPTDNTTLGELLVYPQTATHVLGAPMTLPYLGSYNSGGEMVLADINGDGHTNAVVVTGTHLEAYYQRAGRLTTPVQLPISAEHVTAADINRDGLTDLIVIDPAGQVRVDLQSKAHTFGPSFPVGPIPDVGDQQEKLTAVADMNGDGRPDIVDESRTGYWVSLQTATGAFAPAQQYLTIPDADGYRWDVGGLAVGDVTGDGRADIIQSTNGNVPNSALNIRSQNILGGLNPPRRLDTADIPTSVTVTDLNRDGHPDVLIAHAGWNEVGVYTQQSGGALSAEQLFPVGQASFSQRSVAVGDLNSDGKPDIAVVGGIGVNGVGVLYQH